jgi:DNA repair exonuclease SbcCD nuclease subunit
MTKILRVGDPHVKPNNLEESHRLLQFIWEQANIHKVDTLEILGDLFDTHDIVRLRVLKFWQNWFSVLSRQNFKTRVLVGNHDVTGEYSDPYSALHPFLSLENDRFKIVHEPFVDGPYGYLPYIHSNDKFIEAGNRLADEGARILVSHPNYEGAVYDNGTPITSGVSDAAMDSRFTLLIGGHIHTEIELGRIWYTGNPRWLTKSCSNKRKGIWLCNHDDNGTLIEKTFISTESVCTPMISLTWKEGEEKPTIPEGAKVDIELVGSSDWVTKEKLALKGVSVSTKITDSKKNKERKSGSSLRDFILNHYKADVEKRNRIIKYLGDLNLV